MTMTEDEVMMTLSQALAEIEDESLRARIKEKLISPRKQIRIWDWKFPKHEYREYPVWLLVEIDERDVGIVFADGGFGSEGHPWGLVFISDENTGSPNCWYSSLGDCARDSGFFE
jgi:hypothetical protein